jgi:E3 ubiquitin-protein ligase UBR4
MKDKFLSHVVEMLLVTRGLTVQKTKLKSDCNHLLREILDFNLKESDENKCHFVWACMFGLKIHG